MYVGSRDGYGCGYVGKVMVEMINLRVSEVEHVPYPDVFHLYGASLNGFRELSEVVGYFVIDEDMMGINERGEVKTWINTQFQSDRVGGVRTNEVSMVGQLLSILGGKIAQ